MRAIALPTQIQVTSGLFLSSLCYIIKVYKYTYVWVGVQVHTYIYIYIYVVVVVVVVLFKVVPQTGVDAFFYTYTTNE